MVDFNNENKPAMENPHQQNDIINKQNNITNDLSNVEVPPAPPTNPLLARAELPGATFQLPSLGIFYKNGELTDAALNKDAEITIKPMTAYDEILLNSPDELFNGTAIEKVFHRCVPDVVKPLKLLSKDVDFILACLQLVTYGENKNITFKHTCEDAKEHEYNINIQEIINKTKKIDVSELKTKYTINLPNGQIVKLKPITFDALLVVYQKLSTMKEFTSNAEYEISMNTIISVIDDVDGYNDKNMIKEWLENIPSSWVKIIYDHIDESGDFGTEAKTAIKCKDCGEIVEIDVPLNPINFFTQR